MSVAQQIALVHRPRTRLFVQLGVLGLPVSLSSLSLKNGTRPFCGPRLARPASTTPAGRQIYSDGGLPSWCC